MAANNPCDGGPMERFGPRERPNPAKIIIGSNVHHYAEITSTMDVAWQMAGEGCEEGTVVLADAQTSGRGRHGRAWASAPGRDLLLSVVLRPRPALLARQRPRGGLLEQADVVDCQTGLAGDLGNQLFIRGEGPGLSWDKGVLMECVSPDMWTWSSAEVARPFAYKVLLNDEEWAAGDDFVAAVGVENTISPTF